MYCRRVSFSCYSLITLKYPAWISHIWLIFNPFHKSVLTLVLYWSVVMDQCPPIMWKHVHACTMRLCCFLIFSLCSCGISHNAVVSSYSRNTCWWTEGLKLPVVIFRVFPCLLHSVQWDKSPLWPGQATVLILKQFWQIAWFYLQKICSEGGKHCIAPRL